MPSEMEPQNSALAWGNTNVLRRYWGSPATFSTQTSSREETELAWDAAAAVPAHGRGWHLLVRSPLLNKELGAVQSGPWPSPRGPPGKGLCLCSTLRPTEATCHVFHRGLGGTQLHLLPGEHTTFQDQDPPVRQLRILEPGCGPPEHPASPSMATSLLCHNLFEAPHPSSPLTESGLAGCIHKQTEPNPPLPFSHPSSSLS